MVTCCAVGGRERACRFSKLSQESLVFSSGLRWRTVAAMATGLGLAAAPVLAQPGAAAASCGSAAAVSASRAAEPVEAPLVTFDSAWTIIGRTHWDTSYNGVNWRAVREELRPRAEAARTMGELRAVLTDLVGRLRQSHFSIIPQEVSDATAGTGSASRGSGGSLGFEVRLVDSVMLVAQVDTGGAAWDAGVRPGWVVESVRGCPVASRLSRLPKDADRRRTLLSAYQVTTQAMAGAEGDTLPLVFRDAADKPRALALVQRHAPGSVTKLGNLPPLASRLTWYRVKAGGRTVGVIKFNIWMPVLAAQFDAAIDSLRRSDAIVLDIRGNFGGVGGMSMGFAGHFLDTAIAIGTMHQRGATLNFVANPRRSDTRAQPVKPFAGPVALVVDELSISTTEIFADGLQAVHRATVFGVQTAGQALPSVTERLPNGDILYHAIADFTSPTGKPVEGDGVIPDQVVPVTRKALLAGRDPALDAALAWAAKAAPRALVP
jgi:carboxyl-terminal processing protease